VNPVATMIAPASTTSSPLGPVRVTRNAPASPVLAVTRVESRTSASPFPVTASAIPRIAAPASAKSGVRAA